MKKLIFTKYSNDRADCFSIRTDIWQDENGNRTVQKVPMHPDAKEHLGNLCRWQEELDGLYKEQGFAMNQGKRLENGSIELEYVQGETLAELLDGLLAAGQEEAAAEELKVFIKRVQKPLEKLPEIPFTITDRFREVFWNKEETMEADEDLHREGDEELLAKIADMKIKSLPITNIDLICSNVILGEPMTVIDCVWCFDFPIPISYLLYRILHYYIRTGSNRAGLEAFDLFAWAGITKDQEIVYETMEQSFQKYINRGHTSLDKMFTELGFCGGKLSLDSMAKTERYKIRNHSLEIFYDRGNGFSQEDTCCLWIRDNGFSEFYFAIPEDIQALRLDPGMEPGICLLEKLCCVYEDGREVPVKFTSNGHRLEKDAVYFDKEDPQIIIPEIPKGTKYLRIKLQIHQADAYVMEKYLEKTREHAAAREKYRQRIREMESTKVWKAYRTYRRLLERKKQV